MTALTGWRVDEARSTPHTTILVNDAILSALESHALMLPPEDLP